MKGVNRRKGRAQESRCHSYVNTWHKRVLLQPDEVLACPPHPWTSSLRHRVERQPEVPGWAVGHRCRVSRRLAEPQGNMTWSLFCPATGDGHG